MYVEFPWNIFTQSSVSSSAAALVRQEDGARDLLVLTRVALAELEPRLLRTTSTHGKHLMREAGGEVKGDDRAQDGRQCRGWDAQGCCSEPSRSGLLKVKYCALFFPHVRRAGGCGRGP